MAELSHAAKIHFDEKKCALQRFGDTGASFPRSESSYQSQELCQEPTIYILAPQG